MRQTGSTRSFYLMICNVRTHRDSRPRLICEFTSLNCSRRKRPVRRSPSSDFVGEAEDAELELPELIAVLREQADAMQMCVDERWLRRPKP